MLYLQTIAKIKNIKNMKNHFNRNDLLFKNDFIKFNIDYSAKKSLWKQSKF